ncbi:hypothetical protein IHQ71_27700 [Rhizobium sp. TH2]|uniref:hypothetical protein n=1 Tax=Rhizobium sp. TH2 TaxID=2775403 RepID=UPI00215849CC|nr:hypothetical protein [Rhizobium sp. TH2]UVC08857.1 hypothetical protein IHQ71_27700 [Rhizobium sp. TH2]
MNNSLDRLVEGIIATLRIDVIPNVTDDYARGQAIGVIDLLNNIAPRLEWQRAPLMKAVEARRKVIRQVTSLKGTTAEFPHADKTGDDPSSNDLITERDRLDGEISDLVSWAFSKQTDAAITARPLLRKHMHDDAAEQMKLTKKPLFAEIAKGKAAD